MSTFSPRKTRSQIKKENIEDNNNSECSVPRKKNSETKSEPQKSETKPKRSSTKNKAPSCSKSGPKSTISDETPAKKKSKSTKTDNASKPKSRKRKSDTKIEEEVKSPKKDDFSDDDWEEVPQEGMEDHGKEDQPGPSNMEISVSAPKSKEQCWFETEVRRAFNRIRKGHLLAMHRVHLLCLLSRGRYLSKLCNNQLLSGVMLSTVPSGYIDATQIGMDLALIGRLTKWFKSAFTINGVKNDELYTAERLLQCVELKTANDSTDLLLLFVCLLRSLGLDARIVMSVQPITWKEKDKNGEIKKETAKTKKSAEKRDAWAEIYFADEERWIAVDVLLSGHVDCVSEIEQNCTSPVHYVLAFDNDCAVKDITARYCKDYLSTTLQRHLRVPDDDWYKNTIKKFGSLQRQRDRLEDMLIHNELMSRPLPQTQSGFKNHPLYALESDLLKYEAIYPSETKPVAHFKNQAVYPRSTVHTLYSAQTWLKEARSIRKGQDPYKTVKRIQRGVPKEKMRDDIPPLPVFGFWQTEPYKAKRAKDGKVPRNEFGNVELFKPCMLPPGTVHLQLPGLLFVAKKLDIDCAPAMVGWEFKKAHNYPVMDGWVVCEEHKDILVNAWREEQIIKTENDKKKKHERALDNWKRLTRGVCLCERMRQKFDVVEGEEKEVEIPAAIEDPATSWPQCMEDFSL